jgi:Ni/Fe-hydrogenase subunit HybB-like protein
VIFGITLAFLHQAGLGALFLMARNKLHPLWYSEFIPVLFVVSSVFAGLSLVIVEGSISAKVFAHRTGKLLRWTHEDILLGLGRVAAGTMFAYFFLEIVTVMHGQKWALLATPMGAWYLLEVLGFVLVPGALYVMAYRARNVNWVKAAAGLTLFGVLLNRLNVSIIAFKPFAAVHYVPSWMEVVITLAIVSAEIWIFRWVVNRMPVLDFEEIRPPEAQPMLKRTVAAA